MHKRRLGQRAFEAMAVVDHRLRHCHHAVLIRQFCTEKGIRYPQAMGDERLRDAFDLHGVPQTVLINAQGRIRFWWVGARDLGTLERALKLLQE